MPEFQISDDGPPVDKGCITLIIKTTERTAIDICFDGHSRQEMVSLGDAITQAGGIRARGEFDLVREHHAGRLECYHHFEAYTVEPWSPGKEAK